MACLQELKAEDRAFPDAALRDAGYSAVWHGERTWNGVAILARVTEPVLTRRSLPGDPSDRQSQYIEAAVNGVLIACIYLPNGNPQPGPKFAYKLAWFERLIAHAATLFTTDAPVILAGDYNVVPTEFDIYPTRSWAKDALVQPAPRACFKRLLEQGWTNAIRTLHPKEPMYTFWDYKRERWARDAGLRLDHLLLNHSATTRRPRREWTEMRAGRKGRAIMRLVGAVGDRRGTAAIRGRVRGGPLPAAVTLPVDLRQHIEAALEAEPAIPWDIAVAGIARCVTDGEDP